MPRNYFIMKRSFVYAIESLPNDKAIILFNAIAKYALDKEESTILDPLLKCVFNLITEGIDAYDWVLEEIDSELERQVVLDL